MARPNAPTGTDPADSTDHDTTGDQQLAVAAETLSLTYDDGTEAVDDLSLSIPSGEFFGFLGPNGAGKTTTIKLLATLLEPTGGQARVNGYDVTTQRYAIRASVGYMAQETSIDEELTARENIAFACDAYGVGRDERAGRIDDLLELVDLADVADTPAGQFSGGMKKRLDAATALAHDPQLVFLDEPTTGLDPKARNRLWDYFERINERGTTIFLTTQYLEEADELCDRIAVIRDGSLVVDDSPAALKRRVGGEILSVGVGDTSAIQRAVDVARESDVFGPDATVTETADGIRVSARNARAGGTDLLVALRDAGIDVTGFETERPSLDDVFLSIAGAGVPDTADDSGQEPEGQA